MARPKGKTNANRKIRVVQSSSNTLVKDLKPKDTDLIYYGTEPNFSDRQPDPDNRQGELGKAYNWYSKFYGVKEAKEFLIRYLEDTKQADKAKFIRKVPENKISTSVGWAARAATRGLILDEYQINHIEKQIVKLTEFVKAQDAAAKTEVSRKHVERPNIQQIMRERAGDAAGEIDGIFDDFAAAGYPKDFEMKDRTISLLKVSNVLPQHVSPIIKSWQRLRDEYTELQAGTCEQLNEGYSNMTKMQIKNTLKFIDQVIADLNGYVALKQATKKIRVRKAPPVEKIVSKLKYLKEFKDAAQKLDLVSISPVKLHQATEAWIYDSARRKLHHYIADDYSKCLTIKGNTLLGFDKQQSEMKTLRKPAEQIKGVIGSKPAARKFFKDIKAVAAIPNGRFNDRMIILKAF